MNKTITLLRYATIEGEGWRRGQAVLIPNGRLKPNAIKVGGVEYDATNGRSLMRVVDARSPPMP